MMFKSTQVQILSFLFTDLHYMLLSHLQALARMKVKIPVSFEGENLLFVWAKMLWANLIVGILTYIHACMTILKARTHSATLLAILRAASFTMKFVACNIAEVEQDSTAAILHTILCATISGMDARYNLAIARNIACTVAPCVRAFNHWHILFQLCCNSPC